jgi:transcriptional regulator with XRE-family HTH domain
MLAVKSIFPHIAMRGDGLTSWKIRHFGTRSRLPTEDFFGQWHVFSNTWCRGTRDMKAKKPINYVRSFRLRWGLSQGELSDFLGWNRPDVISRVEKKQRAPSLRFVIACFILFGASAAELFPDIAAGVDKTVMARVWEMYESIQGNPSRKTKVKIALLESAIERAQKRKRALS